LDSARIRRGRRKRHPCDSSMRGLRRLNQYVTHANPQTIDLQRMNYWMNIGAMAAERDGQWEN
jgi:hypothetical protein